MRIMSLLEERQKRLSEIDNAIKLLRSEKKKITPYVYVMLNRIKKRKEKQEK
jgi:inner membrane protein involved in colicin E2 resistance